MRRPTMREGELWPWPAVAGAMLVPVGVIAAREGHAAGLPMATVGVLCLATFVLVAWRLVYGLALSAGLWLLGATGALLALPDRIGPDSADGDGVGGVDTARVQAYWPVPLTAGLIVLAMTVAAIRRRRAGTRGTVNRMARRSRRNDGVASRWQVFRVASWFALRRKARILKPSLQTARVPWLRAWTVPVRQLGTRIARVGWQGVWSPVEDVTLRIGGPRSGKSGEIAGRILDAPGAVIATSTRADLYRITSPLRRKVGPVYVFNPGGLGQLQSTITFDPLSGCERADTAQARASDLLAGGPDGSNRDSEAERWITLARGALAALMHAAAIGGLGMPDVLRWVADPVHHSDVILRLLRRSTVPTFEAAAEQFLKTNDRTQSSITTTIMPSLQWLQNETACAAAGISTVSTVMHGPTVSAVGAVDVAEDPFAGSFGTFDVERLLRERGTVYMLGAEDAQTAPLVTALTGHIAREARRLAGLQPAGRLDPSLTFGLDEAAIICPIPLDLWTADMGGLNITIHIGAQSRAQLRQKFGDAGAAAIMNNCATVMIYGGTRDDEDLAAYVTLAGERDEDVATFDHQQKQSSTTIRRVPVLTAAQIAQLPFGRVLIIRRGMPAALGRVQMAWKRPDVRLQRLARHRRNAATAAAKATRVTARLTAPASAGTGRAADTVASRLGPVVNATFDRTGAYALAGVVRAANRVVAYRVRRQSRAEMQAQLRELTAAPGREPARLGRNELTSTASRRPGLLGLADGDPDRWTDSARHSEGDQGGEDQR